MTQRLYAYTLAERLKLAGIDAGAEANSISDVDATALTGGGETSLHTHPGSGGALPSITHTVDANIDGLDVSSIYPYGLLFLDMAGNREVRSFQGGVDNQLVLVSNLAMSTIKVKDSAGIYQMVITEGGTDRTIGDHGGYTMVFKNGFWHVVSIIQ